MLRTVPLVTSSPRFAPQRAALLDVSEEVQRQEPEILSICAQPRLVDPTLGEELAEDRQRHEPGEHRRPGQKARLNRGLQLPFERLAQPVLFHD